MEFEIIIFLIIILVIFIILYKRNQVVEEDNIELHVDEPKIEYDFQNIPNLRNTLTKINIPEREDSTRMFDIIRQDDSNTVSNIVDYTHKYESYRIR